MSDDRMKIHGDLRDDEYPILSESVQDILRSIAPCLLFEAIVTCHNCGCCTEIGRRCDNCGRIV